MDIVLLEGCNGSDTAGGEESGGVSCRNCPEDVSIDFFVLHCFGESLNGFDAPVSPRTCNNSAVCRNDASLS